MAEERLQKILSQAGITSRRNAEKMILEGRVSVNDQVITQLGSKADLDRDSIRADGRVLQRPKQFLYLALNKPTGYVTTLFDPEGRPKVIDLLKGMRERVYPVGRLDYHSEGLLLLTNDGEIANLVTRAHGELPRTYVVKVNGTLTLEQEEQFRTGIPLGGRRTAPAGLKRLSQAKNPWYEVRLIEGRKNQIRLMFQHCGVLVEKLRRVKIGFLDLGVLKPGQFRFLTPAEVARFQKSVRPKPRPNEVE